LTVIIYQLDRAESIRIKWERYTQTIGASIDARDINLCPEAC
jgi:hypothetical protein